MPRITTAQNRTFLDGDHIGRNDNPAQSYSSDGYRIYGNPQMPKIKLFAVAAAMIATGFGVWAASTSNAHVAPSVGQADPIQVIRTAKDLPTTAKNLPAIEFADYAFLFSHLGLV